MPTYGPYVPLSAAPEWTWTGIRSSSHTDHTGSYTGSWYGGYGAHIDGIKMPPRSPDSRARLISFTAASTSKIGTSATPARRSGLALHSSASQRLWARAPAMSSSMGVSPPAAKPAPNGADAPEVTASASGKMTSPTTP